MKLVVVVVVVEVVELVVDVVVVVWSGGGGGGGGVMWWAGVVVVEVVVVVVVMELVVEVVELRDMRGLVEDPGVVTPRAQQGAEVRGCRAPQKKNSQILKRDLPFRSVAEARVKASDWTPLLSSPCSAPSPPCGLMIWPSRRARSLACSSWVSEGSTGPGDRSRGSGGCWGLEGCGGGGGAAAARSSSAPCWRDASLSALRDWLRASGLEMFEQLGHLRQGRPETHSGGGILLGSTSHRKSLLSACSDVHLRAGSRSRPSISCRMKLRTCSWENWTRPDSSRPIRSWSMYSNTRVISGSGGGWRTGEWGGEWGPPGKVGGSGRSMSDGLLRTSFLCDLWGGVVFFGLQTQ
ncbi:LOW QUALITY PROTEIN: hypothetical protein CRUP_004043 [Coryphaenoides rupestris]|nr:LOW QUALITY PROTEIN: hypothetical protein CRUP_004043 [Coryphaenoides rupestris]